MSPAKSDEESHSASSTANGASINSYLDRLVEAAKEELVYADAQKNTILNLATLQRMLLFHLQVKIIQKVGPLVSGRSSEGNGSTSNGSLDGLETNLAAYAQAVRDWELMADYQAKYGGDSSQDPFCISSKAILTSKVMKSAGLQRVAKQDAYARGTLDKQTGPFSQRNRVNTDRGLKAFLRRFAMALFGGVALVGPMLLMVLHKDRTTDLSTTSVAVFIFAVVVACYSDAAPEAIVGTVAAYAAVLTVFVGTLQSP